MLKTAGIGKEFNGVWVLNNIDFDLRRSEIHALIGENGAGKSTFVKILSGIYPPSAGKYTVNRKQVIFRSVKESEEGGIRTIHQEINLVPYFNAYQNIFIGAELSQKNGLLNDKEMRVRAEEVLSTLNIDLDVNKPVNRLNTSLQRIVQICSALIYKPDILIFDEPTTALGEEERRRLLEIIRGLKDSGIGIIFISHNIEEVVEISDRVTVFKDGYKVDTLNKNEMDTHKIVNMMIGGEEYEAFEREANTQFHEELLRVEGLWTDKLNDISFALHKGEILGIAGVIGAGKSEIARAIFGIDRIKKGRIYINKEQYTPKSTTAVSQGLALVPEERQAQGLVPTFSVLENTTLAYMDHFAGKLFMKNGVEKETTERFIKNLSIKTIGPSQIIKYLSGGNQQKVVLSKWLCGDCNILILDEPTKGIDVMTKRDIYRLIHQITLNGKGVLFMSSYLPEMLNFCDRILVVNNGRLVGEFSSKGSDAKEVITHAMLVGKVS